MSKPRTMAAPLTQQAFPFVTDEERQQMTIAYEKKQERKLYVILRNTRLANISIDVLKGTVLTEKGEQYLRELDQTFSPQFEIPFTFNKEPTEQDRVEDCEAFMRDVPAFLQCMLISTLEKLADVGGADEKIDTLEWVYAGDTRHIDLWVKGRRKSVPLKKIPMTFNWVCEQLGSDPDEIRTGIEAELLKAQRDARRKISLGELQPKKDVALSNAINFINERSSNGRSTNYASAEDFQGL